MLLETMNLHILISLATQSSSVYCVIMKQIRLQILEAKFKDEPDCYELRIVLAKPGIPRKYENT